MAAGAPESVPPPCVSQELLSPAGSPLALGPVSFSIASGPDWLGEWQDNAMEDSPVTQQPPSRNHWTCDACDETNADRRTECNNCGKPRALSQAATPADCSSIAIESAGAEMVDAESTSHNGTGARWAWCAVPASNDPSPVAGSTTVDLAAEDDLARCACEAAFCSQPPGSEILSSPVDAAAFEFATVDIAAAEAAAAKFPESPLTAAQIAVDDNSKVAAAESPGTEVKPAAEAAVGEVVAAGYEPVTTQVAGASVNEVEAAEYESAAAQALLGGGGALPPQHRAALSLEAARAEQDWARVSDGIAMLRAELQAAAAAAPVSAIPRAEVQAAATAAPVAARPRSRMSRMKKVIAESDDESTAPDAAHAQVSSSKPPIVQLEAAMKQKEIHVADFMASEGPAKQQVQEAVFQPEPAAAQQVASQCKLQKAAGTRGLEVEQSAEKMTLAAPPLACPFNDPEASCPEPCVEPATVQSTCKLVELQMQPSQKLGHVEEPCMDASSNAGLCKGLQRELSVETTVAAWEEDEAEPEAEVDGEVLQEDVALPVGGKPQLAPSDRQAATDALDASPTNSDWQPPCGEAPGSQKVLDGGHVVFLPWHEPAVARESTDERADPRAETVMDDLLNFIASKDEQLLSSPSAKSARQLEAEDFPDARISAYRVDSDVSTMSADEELPSLVSQRLLDNGHVVAIPQQKKEQEEEPEEEEEDFDAIPDERPVTAPPCCKASGPSAMLGQRAEPATASAGEESSRDGSSTAAALEGVTDEVQVIAEPIKAEPVAADGRPGVDEEPNCCIAAAETASGVPAATPDAKAKAKASTTRSRKAVGTSCGRGRNPAPAVGELLGAMDAAGRDFTDFFNRISQETNKAAGHFQQLLAPVLEAVEGIGADDSEEESEDEGQNQQDSLMVHQMRQAELQGLQASRQATPFSAAPPGSPAPPGYPPLAHPAFKGMHEAASAPLLGVARDLAAIYRRFHDSNELHMRTQRRPSPEAHYGMASCLSLGASRVLASNGTDTVPGLPPIPDVAGLTALQLVETRLDLAIMLLNKAVESGYSAVNSMMADLDMQAVRERRQPQFMLALQRAQANAAAARNAPQTPEAATVLTAAGLRVNPPVAAPRGTSWPLGTQAGTSSPMFPGPPRVQHSSSLPCLSSTQPPAGPAVTIATKPVAMASSRVVV